MAKKEKIESVRNEKEGGIYAYLMKMKDERIQTMLGLVLLTIGLYLALAFVSFFFTGWQDQSLVVNTKGYTLDYINENVKNWAGLTGARIADFFINRTFGVSCLLYLFYYFVFALWMMYIRPLRMVRTFLICSFFLIWLSVFFGFFFLNTYDSTHLFLGGEHGYYISLWLRSNVGVAGTSLLLLISLILFIICAYKTALPKIKSVGSTVWSKFNKLGDDNGGVILNETAQGVVMDESVHSDELSDEIASDENAPVSLVNDNTDIEEANNSEEQTDDQVVEVAKQLYNDSPNDIESNHAVSQENETPTLSGELDNAPASVMAANTENVTIVEPDFMITTGAQDDIAEEIDNELYDPTKDLSYYKKPSVDLFDKSVVSGPTINMDEQKQNKDRIVEVLKSFGVEIATITATVGPTVTLYEVTPAAGVRISRIRSLGDDIALSIAAKGIRIIAPIPAKGTIGIEVPNTKAQTVPMADIISSKKFQESKFELPIAIGKTITNEVYMVDLAKMPHVLVAGATGQGKSVGLNAIITSILYKKHPSEVKFVMVDPKMVEFSMYAPIENHFLAKLSDAEEAIITDVSKVVETLKSLCVEMDNRYALLKDANVRQLKEYNEKFIARKLNPNHGHHFMPYIVVIIDEFADLIMQVGKDVEQPIARIAQKARAVGIHMILATQRPSANIITGVIRANFPARFAFRVSTQLESRVILDQGGAEQLIGRGDMLISVGQDFDRVQCAFVDTPEVERITKYISEQQGYPTAFILPDPPSEGDATGPKDVDLTKLDPLFEEVAALIVSTQQGSTSMIQRKLSLGYNRAGRLMDQLEVAGIVGPQEGSKPRQVLVTDLDQLDMMIKNLKKS